MFYKLKCLTIKNRAVGHDDIALCAVIFALCARYIVLSDNEIALRAVIFALCAIYYCPCGQRYCGKAAVKEY